MAIEKWNLQKEEHLAGGYGRNLVLRTYEMPDGSIQEFYIVDSGIAICTLALTEDNDVILARQYRPGPDAILDELPGGMLECGEGPLKAAARELLEETGYSGDMVSTATNHHNAYATTMKHFFIATNCKKTAEQNLDTTEYIEVVLKPLPEFLTQMRSGALTDMEVAYLGLDHLDLLNPT